MYPQTDAPLRAMPLDSKADAELFVAAYKAWIYENSATGNGRFLKAKGKPATVRAPDLVAKAHRATEIAEMNYWQMPYDEARRKYYGLPRINWERARKERGLLVDQIQN